MSHRKLQQEIDKCFKQVDLGVEAFDNQYEKYEQSTNAAQREKLVDSIKKECKKLQRLRDQIKTWAAGNEVKDKSGLQDKRELIETKMEAFKAVEKEMKTKAFSKEGLSVSAKLDPKEKEKEEVSNFLSDMVQELDHQKESHEAELESLHAQSKKPKKDTPKSERIAELDHRIERHKWHQDQLELLMRALANDDVEAQQVRDIEDDIRHYVDNNQEVDFYEDDSIYDELGLDEESGRFAVQQEIDRVPSQDRDVSSDESPEPTGDIKAKHKATPEPSAAPIRRSSQQIKSPLPALATLHNLPATSATSTASNSMKPALPPSKPPGEALKYASAAAAAAASDAAGIGISPLPPPPSKQPPPPQLVPEPSAPSSKSSVPASPTATTAQPLTSQVSNEYRTQPELSAPKSAKSPAPSHSSIGGPSPAVSSSQLAQESTRDAQSMAPSHNGTVPPQEAVEGQNHDREAYVNGYHSDATANQTDGVRNQQTEDGEPVYHLPASLKELVECYENVKNSALPPSQPEHQQMLQASFASRPSAIDAERPRFYKPSNPALYTPPHYPQEPLAIFNDPRLYDKVDEDALFYSFYYKQGTYQQYLAAKTLKNRSWRFHKQYQTWFQRHEEPKEIKEEYEQGTYRFFDYESTWMNRRKADFQFAYKFLEDEL